MKNTKAYEHIQRHMGGQEVVDADVDLRIFPNASDLKNATPRDPSCCVFAEAAKRQLGATKVLFWRSVAYVELPVADGVRRVERFTMSPQMRQLVENFDNGRDVLPEAGFVLKAPRPSYTLAGKRAQRERAKSRSPGEKAAGKKRKKVRAYSKPAIVVNTNTRNGTGQVRLS